MGMLSWIIQGNPIYNHKSPYKREAGRSKEEVGNVMTDAKGWDDARKRAGAKERKRPPESRKSKDTDSPTEPPNGARPAYTLTIAE